MLINDAVVYEGPQAVVPRIGDDIRYDDQVVRVEAVVWDFREAGDVTSVSVLVGDRPYTF